MSDGPHRTLPMPRHWKRFAEWAATPAYGPDEVNEALALALKADFREAPVAEVAESFCGERQASLFDDERIEQELEALRDSHPGSVATTTLIDCASETLTNKLHGERAAKVALKNALQAQRASAFRDIEEHYQRAGRLNTEFRERLRAARDQCRFGAIASELVADRPSASALRLPKRSGVDEGPPL